MFRTDNFLDLYDDTFNLVLDSVSKDDVRSLSAVSKLSKDRAGKYEKSKIKAGINSWLIANKFGVIDFDKEFSSVSLGDLRALSYWLHDLSYNRDGFIKILQWLQSESVSIINSSSFWKAVLILLSTRLGYISIDNKKLDHVGLLRLAKTKISGALLDVRGKRKLTSFFDKKLSNGQSFSDLKDSYSNQLSSHFSGSDTVIKYSAHYIRGYNILFAENPWLAINFARLILSLDTKTFESISSIVSSVCQVSRAKEFESWAKAASAFIFSAEHYEHIDDLLSDIKKYYDRYHSNEFGHAGNKYYSFRYMLPTRGFHSKLNYLMLNFPNKSIDYQSHYDIVMFLFNKFNIKNPIFAFSVFMQSLARGDTRLQVVARASRLFSFVQSLNSNDLSRFISSLQETLLKDIRNNALINDLDRLTPDFNNDLMSKFFKSTNELQFYLETFSKLPWKINVFLNQIYERSIVNDRYAVSTMAHAFREFSPLLDLHAVTLSQIANSIRSESHFSLIARYFAWLSYNPSSFNILTADPILFMYLIDERANFIVKMLMNLGTAGAKLYLLRFYHNTLYMQSNTDYWLCYQPTPNNYHSGNIPHISDRLRRLLFVIDQFDILQVLDKVNIDIPEGFIPYPGRNKFDLIMYIITCIDSAGFKNVDTDSLLTILQELCTRDNSPLERELYKYKNFQDALNNIAYIHNSINLYVDHALDDVNFDVSAFFADEPVSTNPSTVFSPNNPLKRTLDQSDIAQPKTQPSKSQKTDDNTRKFNK